MISVEDWAEIRRLVKLMYFGRAWYSESIPITVLPA